MEPKLPRRIETARDGVPESGLTTLKKAGSLRLWDVPLGKSSFSASNNFKLTRCNFRVNKNRDVAGRRAERWRCGAADAGVNRRTRGACAPRAIADTVHRIKNATSAQVRWLQSCLKQMSGGCSAHLYQLPRVVRFWSQGRSGLPGVAPTLPIGLGGLKTCESVHFLICACPSQKAMPPAPL